MAAFGFLPKLLKGWIMLGTIRGVSKGDTRSLDSPWDLAWTLDP